MTQAKRIGTLAFFLIFAFMLPGFLLAGGQGEKAEAITLEFWMPGQEPTIRSTYGTLIEQYINEHPNIKINYTQTPWQEWFAKLATAIAGNLVPDISGAGFGQFGMLCTQDIFAEIPYDLGDVQDWSIKTSSYKGKQYSVYYPETRPLAYRIDFFKAAGLDPNKPPTTWDELVDYAKKLTKRQGGKVSRAGLDITYIQGGEQILLVFYAQRKKGAHLWEEGGKPTFYTPEGIETLQWLVDLKVKHDVLVPSDAHALMGTAFEQGAAAMGFPKSQGLPALLKAQPGNVGFAKPTMYEDNAALTLGTFIGVYKNARQQKEAFDFQEYLYSPDSMWAIYKGILFLPSRDSLEQKFVADQPFNEVLAFCLKKSVNYNINPHFGEARTTVQEQIAEAFYGNKTPEQALKDAHDHLMGLLE
jgi:multiple sugar transport system substrate-binding protein